MRVRILLFGPYAAAAGAPSVWVDAEDGCTCVRFMELLAAQHPVLRTLLGGANGVRGARLAVNHEFAADERVLMSADEIALIGMVSGG